MKFQTFALQLLFACFLVLQSLPASSCSCPGPYDTVFCAAAGPYQHIIYGKVLERTHPSYARVAVFENIHLTIPYDTIAMMGQDGINCGESLDRLSVGAEYVLALFEEPADGPDTFLLGGCSQNFYPIEGGMVQGQITPGIRDIRYETLRDNIEGLLGCTLANHSFVSEANRWNRRTGWLSILTGNGRLYTEIYRFQDTIHRNGQVYRRLWATEDPDLQGWEYTGLAFREEPPGKVYRYWELQQGEELAYDFTAEEGEEIDFGDPNDNFIVHQIDFIQLSDGSSRKRMLVSLARRAPSWTDYWIEGIGSERSPFNPHEAFIFDFYTDLLCYYQNEELLHVTDAANDPEGCYQVIVATQEKSITLNWAVSPNPINNQLNLSFDQPIPHALHLRLLNQLGQEVGERRLPAFTERTSWEVAGLAPGLYFVELQVEGQVVEAKKVVKQR